MKKIIAVALLSVFAASAAKADCEAYTFEMVPTPTPEPPPIYEQTVQTFEWSEAEIDGLASIYWAECNTDKEKCAVTQLILNRVSHGTPFADTLVGVIHQSGEFNRGHVSDRNREKAQENLDYCYSGCCGIPKSAVYMGRQNGVLTFFDIEWRKVWQVR